MRDKPEAHGAVCRRFKDEAIGLIEPAFHDPFPARAKLFDLEGGMSVIFHQEQDALPDLWLNIFRELIRIQDEVICEKEAILGHRSKTILPFQTRRSYAGIMG